MLIHYIHNPESDMYQQEGGVSDGLANFKLNIDCRTIGMIGFLIDLKLYPT